LSDDDSFTGRVRRYARVGGAMGGLAARLAGERYLGLPLDRERHAADLKAAGEKAGDCKLTRLAEDVVAGLIASVRALLGVEELHARADAVNPGTANRDTPATGIEPTPE